MPLPCTHHCHVMTLAKTLYIPCVSIDSACPLLNLCVALPAAYLQAHGGWAPPPYPYPHSTAPPTWPGMYGAGDWEQGGYGYRPGGYGVPPYTQQWGQQQWGQWGPSQGAAQGPAPAAAGLCAACELRQFQQAYVAWREQYQRWEQQYMA